MDNSLAGNEIYSASLTIDGSTKPPGDLIHLTILLFNDVKNAEVRISAFTVSGNKNEEQKQVPSRNQRTSDAHGNFEIVAKLRSEGKNIDQKKDLEADLNEESRITAFERSLVVPFADLKLDKGEYQLGYLVTLVVDTKVASLQPLDLTKVVVTDKNSKTMVVGTQKFVPEVRTKDLTTNVFKEGKLISGEIKQTFTVKSPVFEFEAKSLEVAIAGEFQREIVNAALLSGRDFVPESKRTIYFATNRQIDKRDGDADTRFGNESVVALDAASYGKCVVNIPIDHHEPGKIETPGTTWFFWREAPDPSKHFMVDKMELISSAKAFTNDIGPDDVLVYVHGYNNTFKDSILRSAQLQHDLKFGGRVVAFSWPSSGNTLLNIGNPFDNSERLVQFAYGHDEDMAKQSYPFLANFLKRLILGNGQTKPKRVHVLAHSMGNRVLLNSLDLLNSEKFFDKPENKLGYVILAAADVDGSTFSNVRDALKASCVRITYYFATSDGALTLSRAKHGDKPIGLGPLFDDSQMDTIDATDATNILNGMAHLYATEARPILTDIRLLITKQLLPVQRRPPLGSKVPAEGLNGRFYWTLPPITR